MRDFTELSHRRYGEERTPSGEPRYLFWFGVHNGAFFVWKFQVRRPVNQAPVCVVMCPFMRYLDTTTKEIGLRLTKKERDELAEEMKQFEIPN